MGHDKGRALFAGGDAVRDQGEKGHAHAGLGLQKPALAPAAVQLHGFGQLRLRVAGEQLVEGEELPELRAGLRLPGSGVLRVKGQLTAEFAEAAAEIFFGIVEFGDALFRLHSHENSFLSKCKGQGQMLRTGERIPAGSE